MTQMAGNNKNRELSFDDGALFFVAVSNSNYLIGAFLSVLPTR